jgi:predicted ATP-binding protein involved in virulence
VKIKNINIEKLFGYFDYTIELNQEEGITILTGPNGYGKTTILNIINNIYHRNMNYLKSMKINKAAIFFENDQSIWFNKGDKNTKELGYTSLSVYNEFWAETKDKKYDVSLIKDQRLIREEIVPNNKIIASGAFFTPDSKQIVSAIASYANEMRALLINKKNEESKLSEKLNATQFNRIKECTPLNMDEYKSRFEVFHKKYNQLLAMGIYSESIQYTEYDENKQYLSVFLEDFEKKIDIYNEIIIKAEIFSEILNEKFFTNKQVFIDFRNGFAIKTKTNDNINLTSLSSGEQQEIVLLYELLFKTKHESMVLIDEPETSLHIVWQRQFINDLMKIRRTNNNLSFIVATHSPQIVASHYDLCIDLYDLSLEKKENA